MGLSSEVQVNGDDTGSYTIELSKSTKSYENCIRVSCSVKGKSLFIPSSGREWATSYTVNVGWNRKKSGIRILPLLSVNGLPGGWMSGKRSGQLLVLRMGNYS